MGRKKGNFIEAIGEEDYISGDEGKKKPHARKRKSTDAKYREVRELFGEKEIKEIPPSARNLHIVARIPDKKAAYRVEPTQGMVARKPLVEENDAEKIAKLEEKIRSKEFNEAEKEFFEMMVENYSRELQEAKKKRKENGGIVDDKWATLVRTSYINDRKRFSLDKSRWGINGPLAPEKADLLEKYLELKLPVGIPEEKKKNSNPDMNSEEEKEKSFTPEQSSELLQLIGVVSQRFKEWIKDSKNWGSEFGDEETRKKAIFDQIIKEMMADVIKNDAVMKDIFSEEEIQKAVEHSLKFIEKFNFKSKK
jgi:hypothetical protein